MKMTYLRHTALLLGAALLVGCGEKSASVPASTPPPSTDAQGKIQGPPPAFQPPAKSSAKKGR